MTSFFTYLDYLRSKPEGVRRQIAFWASLLVTCFILILWFVNLRLAAPPAQSPTIVKEERATAPFWPRVGQGFKEVQLRIQEGWRVITKK